MCVRQQGHLDRTRMTRKEMHIRELPGLAVYYLAGVDDRRCTHSLTRESLAVAVYWKDDLGLADSDFYFYFTFTCTKWFAS